MIISFSVVTGFQKEVRNKVVGFGSHFQITEFSDNQSFESSPMPVKQEFYPSITSIDGVNHIQVFAYKPAILQSNKDTISYNFIDAQGEKKDTTRIDRNIKGVITKGIASDFSWSFFDQYIIDGERLNLDADEVQHEIMISKKIAESLRFKVGDEMRAYFIQNTGPITKRFTIKGIYSTGLEDFDNDLVFIDIRHLQVLNNWGVFAGLTVDDTCLNEQLIISANANGGNENYRYNWLDGRGWTDKYRRLICPTSDTTFGVAVSDFTRNGFPDRSSMISAPDTAYVKLTLDGNFKAGEFCYCSTGNPTKVTYTDSTKTIYFGDTASVHVWLYSAGGSADQYVGGFELFIDDWSKLDHLKEEIKNYIGPTIEAKPIDEIYPEIFNWLDFLDTNVYIILILVLFVAVINMSSALLVMILERTNFIGLLKAMGSVNSTIVQVFLFLSGHILLRGLIWGNLISIGLLLIQSYFHVIPLNPEVYYLSEVPVNIDITYLIVLNLSTLIICMLVLILPALFISRIKPVKAIKFN